MVGAPVLAVPLRQQGELVGLLNARRIEVRPFTPVQVKLLETFADQAVIAHRERSAIPRTQGVTGAADRDERNLRRDRQLADRNPTSAGYRRGKCCAVCGANDAVIRLVEGNVLRTRGTLRISAGGRGGKADRPRFADGRAVVDRQVIHVDDLLSV